MATINELINLANFKRQQNIENNPFFGLSQGFKEGVAVFEEGQLKEKELESELERLRQITEMKSQVEAQQKDAKNQAVLEQAKKYGFLQDLASQSEPLTGANEVGKVLEDKDGAKLHRNVTGTKIVSGVKQGNTIPSGMRRTGGLTMKDGKLSFQTGIKIMSAQDEKAQFDLQQGKESLRKNQLKDKAEDAFVFGKIDESDLTRLEREQDFDIPQDRFIELKRERQRFLSGRNIQKMEDVIGEPRYIPSKGSKLIPKGFDIEKGIPKDIVDIEGIKSIGEEETKIKSKEKSALVWSNDAAQREIKRSVIDPKLNFFMEVGGRAYRELKEEAKNQGIELDFTAKGPEVFKNMLVKKGLSISKFTPLMDALDKLRPELGTELMRQLGAFRSGEMAKKFENTLASFSGNIRADIADMTTTIAKNQANVDLLDEEGNVLPDYIRDKKMREAEANLIRKYNFMYRNMGIMDRPYLAGYTFEDIAERSSFNENEEELIQEAIRDNPGFDRIQIISKLIEKGLL